MRHGRLSQKASVLRCDFASAKPRASLSHLSVAARGITVHGSQHYAAELWTISRHMSPGETAQSRAAVGYHVCSLVN